MPGFAKQAHESEVMKEEAQIKVFEAAINLSPAEIRNVGQTVFQSSVKCADSFTRERMAKRDGPGGDPQCSNGMLGVAGRFIEDLLAVWQCNIAC